MPIALFVDTPSSRWDLAAELALAVAELCVAEYHRLYLLSDSLTLLEVGIGLLGSRESRTVEGGEYKASPIIVLPPIPRPNRWEDTVLGSAEDLSVGGDIDEFYQLGLFARSEEVETGLEWDTNPAVAFEEVIATAHPNIIIGLGSDSELWNSVVRGLKRSSEGYVPRLVFIDGFEPTVEVAGRFERAFVHKPDRFRVEGRTTEETGEESALAHIRLKAEGDGALMAGLFEYLTRSARS